MISYSRMGRGAADPRDSAKLHHNQQFVLTGMADASFDELTPATIRNNNDVTITRLNAGPDVATTVTDVGLPTKVVTYEVGILCAGWGLSGGAS